MIIQHAVWLYLRFTLSYRVVEELLAERGRESLYRDDRSGMTARMYLSSVGWPRAGREM